ncbi:MULTISPECIES: hypothetical protein [Nostoc]|uniref:Uncharacterized protein n=1 Tax=Nostoc paludosum FACHB-159 TaxID=2692908 RepID=A0ABR8KM47_9NOSO|nr:MULTISPECIES: hypothetical protein [Nostoc]MBD2739200.1 hypothetical protein [Nostoc paludosum FACHB-159]
MAWVEPWTVPAMLTGNKVDANRLRAINTDLFTSEVDMSVPSSQAIISFPTLYLSGGLSWVLSRGS